jgi:SSS family solute:Na+ symporter
MERLSLLDLGIILGYNLAVVALGCGFFRRSRTSERFMAAGRAVPGWAVGLSLFGSYVSSISFLANPGKAYGGDWNASVFAFSMPLAAWIAARWFVPFYRAAGAVSGYEHLERRFGAWARTYAVLCFLLYQIVRLGTILYLLALALEPLLGPDVKAIILAAAAVVVVYPLLGGAEAWIWTGVLQGLLLLGGVAACVVSLLAGMPGGPEDVVRIALEEDKLKLGSFDPGDLSQSTFWVVLLYGLVTHLQNFGVDQSYSQRYITAASPRAAARSIWIGTWMFIPVSLSFFFIGTALFAFYRAQPGLLPPEIGGAPDRVFPFFIGTQLPAGVTGLVIAAICAAAMDSNLTSSATLFLCDLYRRYLRPGAGEREALRVLRLSTLGFGAASTAVALGMVRLARDDKTLDVWWDLAGAASGGVLGLFLLGLLCRRAGGGAALLGVACGVPLILWIAFSRSLPESLKAYRCPFHSLLALVFGTVVILAVGAAAAYFPRRAWKRAAVEEAGAP